MLNFQEIQLVRKAGRAVRRIIDVFPTGRSVTEVTIVVTEVTKDRTAVLPVILLVSVLKFLLRVIQLWIIYNAEVLQSP